MVTKSNFLVITIIMLVVLIMFQSTSISEEIALSSGENLSLELGADMDAQLQLREEYDEISGELSSGDAAECRIGLVGSDEPCLRYAREWCVNQKKSYCGYLNLEDAANDSDCPDMLIVDSSLITPESGDALRTLGSRDKTVVISGLPSVSVLESSDAVMDCLGIETVREEEVELDGFKMFANFILGGEVVYDDYAMSLPFVQLDSSVRVFIVGQSDESWFEELENEELPPLLWRNYNYTGSVYVVNADFLEGHIAAGILTGIASDAAAEYVYPVVNAQMSIVNAFPLLADENTEAVYNNYGQGSIAVFRDIIWPTIAAIYYDTDEQMTTICSPKLDYVSYEQTSYETLEYLYQEISKMRGEMGLSGYQVSDIPSEEKLTEDAEVFGEQLPNYKIQTFYSGGLELDEYESLFDTGEVLEDIRTVLAPYEEQGSDSFFDYVGSDSVLRLSIYMDSTVHEDEDDFRLCCLQTAYGYYSTMTDLSKVVYPEEPNDLFNIMSEDWAKYYRPYRIRFSYFDKLTATAADARVRSYLAIDYDYFREGDEITIAPVTDSEECYFILRLHGEEITGITGGSYTELETDWYLINITDESAVVTVEQTNKTEYTGG